MREMEREMKSEKESLRRHQVQDLARLDQTIKGEENANGSLT